MKLKAFILTFIAYAMMHSLRTGYSYSKPYFKAEFGFSNSYLALMDSSIYIAMGIGFFLRYFFIIRKGILFSFFYTGIIFLTAFALFPLLAIANLINDSNSQAISLVLMILFGFFQMHYWPVLLLIINDYFTN
jgi:sugar phosphate permease